ncbi:hypothetical protein F0562_006642 [Nyssa sinensis]|uniref:Protein kinase domain-containing protein n=1 Tax=Nyssa sinensis TaxID=561372 RepID=A0A5J5ARI5_9ASTE|nr:hypothetical protein F0562_006642 [Nyssa sinensis]
MVRLHFQPFSSQQERLSDAQFNVSASGSLLLSNFSVQTSNNSLVIKEFLITIDVGKFRINFTPSQISSFAFVNAIEVFLAPESFIHDVATHVSPSRSNSSTYHGLLSGVLHTIHRINVGGVTLTPENDTLGRNWVPDDDYLSYRDAAKNSEFYSETPKYQPEGASEYIAPALVYQTAKELNIDPTSRQSNFFNITWLFKVNKNVKHLVRVHFCDIVSSSRNIIHFNLYVYTEFSQEIDPDQIIPQLAAPFYYDFVVDSDGSGFMNICIGPRNDSVNQTAFLNGLEIMELLEGKAKPVETLDWPAVPLSGGSSYNRITERTANVSPLPNLNLGLKITFSEILYATKNFDTKLMIGEGGFGKVYKGTLRSGMKVAVKRSEAGHGQGLPEFQTEIMILSRIRQRHLVSLVGYCDERSEMIIVYEFMEKGSLRDHLYNSRGDSEKSSSRSELSWNQRLEICIGASKGLHYLHTGSDGGIIHRDVKSTNILLDEHYVAKVADFGLSRSGPPDQTHVSTEVKGSFGYLDPEYFRCLQLTQKSDVYSFGVVLLEVLCARPAINPLLPREEVNLAEWGMYWQKKGELEKIVDPLLVGKINPNSLRKFGETVEKCLKEYGVDRPSMHDVLWDLEYALQLQQTARHREPHEDSTTDVSWQLPLAVVQRLPSHSIPVDEDDVPLGAYEVSDTSLANATEVFSQLRIDDAR